LARKPAASPPDRNRPEIEEHLGTGFRAQVEEIQETARAAYDERLAELERELAAERAETAETERLLAEERAETAETERLLAEERAETAELIELNRRWQELISQMGQLLQELQ
jgi:hypothetical protein